MSKMMCTDSFGVVLLEILTGRKPVNHRLPRGQKSLVTWVPTPLSPSHLFHICRLQKTFTMHHATTKLSELRQGQTMH